MSHMDRLQSVAKKDVERLLEAEKSYGSSWKKRGGVGAFMMLARKWDRLETALKPHPDAPEVANGADPGGPRRCPAAWDIIESALYDQREEGIIDDIRDLRRYLLLVEAEILEQRKDPSGSVYRTADNPVPGGVRYPKNLTNYEYNNTYTGKFLESGTQANRRVTELYRMNSESDTHTVHPYSMMPEFVEEYGS